MSNPTIPYSVRQKRAQGNCRVRHKAWLWAVILGAWLTPAFGQAPEMEEMQPEMPEESGPVRASPPPVVTPSEPPAKPVPEPPTGVPPEVPKEEPAVPHRPTPAEQIRRLAQDMLDILTADQGISRTRFLHRVQLSNDYLDLRGPAKRDAATLRVDWPILEGIGFLRADVPVVWVDPNVSGRSTSTGIGDLFLRNGYRFVDLPGFKLLADFDLTLPTATDDALGRGRYQVAPGLTLGFPIPELNSMFFPSVQQFWSVGGDESRPEISFTRVKVSLDTPWALVWWTTLEATLNADWTQNAKTGMTLTLEAGRSLGPHLRAWAQGGVGLWGEGVPGSYDWLATVGVRYMF